MPERYTTLIGGDWIHSSDNNWFAIRNPADSDEIVALVPELTDVDASNALDAAADGFTVWSTTPLIERGLVLSRAADLLRARVEDIARIVTMEMGKTIRDSRQEVTKAADFFDYYASFARFATGYLLADGRPGVDVHVLREPIGIVLAITPWNDPVITPARKLAPALISGNSVVLKPAPESPLSSLSLARVLADAGLPADVLNVVTGSDDRIGQRLVESKAYDALTFTGSNAVGEQLRGILGQSRIRLQTEMGGKNCLVVTPSAQLQPAVDAAISGAFVQAGQRCTATSRVVVDEGIYEDFVTALVDRTRYLRVGPGSRESTDIGPVISAARLESVLEVVKQTQADGADIVGGAAITDEACARGHFMMPTIISNASRESALWEDELFAPVLAIATTRSFDEALTAVNESRFGLSAAIFTQNLTEAMMFEKRADVGCVSVNLPTAGWDVHLPFGGFKASGSGYKEQGIQGLEFYSRWKTVAVRALAPSDPERR